MMDEWMNIMNPRTHLMPSASKAMTLNPATSTVKWLPGDRINPLAAATTSCTSHPALILGVGPIASITNCSALSCSDHFSLTTNTPYSPPFNFFGKSTSSANSLPSDFFEWAAACSASEPGAGRSFLIQRVGTGLGLPCIVYYLL